MYHVHHAEAYNRAQVDGAALGVLFKTLQRFEVTEPSAGYTKWM